MKKMLGTIARRFLAILLAFIMVLLTVVVAVGIPLANNYKNMVSMFLSQTTFTAEGGSNPQYFTSDYANAEEVDKAFVDFVLGVASGNKVNNEKSEYSEIAIFKSGVTL